jgi:hypothetical protein
VGNGLVVEGMQLYICSYTYVYSSLVLMCYLSRVLFLRKRLQSSNIRVPASLSNFCPSSCARTTLSLSSGTACMPQMNIMA